MQPPSHSHETGHSSAPSWLKLLGMGTALAVGTVIISPYLFPALGIESLLDVEVEKAAEQSLSAVHSSGIAAGLNETIKLIPGIGPSLAAGGWSSLIATGAIGIGGVLLSQYVEKREDGTMKFRWSNIIRTAALVSSALIALPAMLSGISAGIVYLCAIFSGMEMMGQAIAVLSNTIGSVGMASMLDSGAGALAVVPHLLTCGASMILPASIGWLSGRTESSAPIPAYVPAPEMSAPAASSFVQMLAEPVPPAPTFRIESEPLARPVPGQPNRIRFSLKNAATGLPLTTEELAIVHTEKLHLFVVDQSLKEYHHLHPAATEPGVFEFSFTPRSAGAYTMWAEFATARDGQHHQAATALFTAPARTAPSSVTLNTQMETRDAVFSWQSAEPLRAGEPAIVEISAVDKRGNPLTDLEPFMGAFAHLVGFSADGKSLLHAHPLGPEPISENERGGPRLRFQLTPESAGPMQFHLQIKRGGQIVTLPFGQSVRPPALTTEAVRGAHAGHGAPAFGR